jgi:hypothetical protein
VVGGAKSNDGMKAWSFINHSLPTKQKPSDHLNNPNTIEQIASGWINQFGWRYLTFFWPEDYLMSA